MGGKQEQLVLQQERDGGEEDLGLWKLRNPILGGL